LGKRQDEANEIDGVTQAQREERLDRDEGSDSDDDDDDDDDEEGSDVDMEDDE